MRVQPLWKLIVLSLLISLFLVSCGNEEVVPTLTITPLPTPTNKPIATPLAAATRAWPQAVDEIEYITVAIDAPSRTRQFSDFDPFGHVIGFEADLMEEIRTRTNWQYEFVVTPFDGMLASVAEGEFDVALSAIAVPAEPVAGVAFTNPYLEIGQVLVVRADETVIQATTDLQPGMPVAVQEFSRGVNAAAQLRLNQEDILLTQSPIQALQAVIDGTVRAAIVDHTDAEYFSITYFQQLRMVGATENDSHSAWISSKQYVMAVAAENTVLLAALNEVIAQIGQDEVAGPRLATAWLIAPDTLEAGESLIGTAANEIVIGVTGELTNIDPAAATPNLISWEIKINTMSGLYMLDAESNLVPVLAAGLPTISADGLEYTIPLRQGLTFPDGRPFSALDVKWSLDRAASLGNWLVNSFLKDVADNGFADADAVQVLSDYQVKIVLQEPMPHFLSLLATPPYFVVSQNCFTLVFDAISTCGGIGPYTISNWEQGELLRLKANPQWPGAEPQFENITLHFYTDAAAMRSALERGSIDMAWTGLRYQDILDLRTGNYNVTVGPPVFKSYLVFEQSEPPWDSRLVRQAAAYAIDREALARDVYQDTRSALYSPIPTNLAESQPLEPARDLNRARQLLAAAGYSATNPLPVTIHFLNDGRYGPQEPAYAEAIKAQLEETGIFQVTLVGAPWDVFSGQITSCAYPAFLLGWPPLNSPPRFVGGMDWITYFVTNTETICSNYDSTTMERLYGDLFEPAASLNPAQLQAIYTDIQELWAQEYPTLDLTQEPRLVIALPKIANAHIDALGLLHYETLTKNP
ncbi:MAG: transporter substrate-binding domain-containing protein [Chloroflexi bacterium]|nr:transporter substrate-binding domain-containing protein [Chloroflexota bacterium]MBP8057897.1 transporter substrate-binding domain-containing protein [Chloroflexota bacterium]